MSRCRPKQRTRHLTWRRVAALTAALLLPVAGAEAQTETGTVVGQVVQTATGMPLSNVQVTVAGSNVGTVTDQNGRFRIANVRPGTRQIRAQMIGYRTATETVEVPAGGTVTLNLQLTESAVALDELVVTALGIERPQRELTTSVQSISGEAMTQAPDVNLVSALAGKVSGVHILSSNTPGGSARMVIRGVNSLTGYNQPLFVVDGIPVSNAASTSGTRGYNAIDYGNLMQDLNPNDIESITVLKGPNASALYGSRAANGAVIITTKRGMSNAGIGMVARADMTFESPLRLPDYQNLYGQGFSGSFEATEDQSWGPRMDGRLIEQPIYDGEARPFVPHPNNVRDFFETGRTMNTSVSLGTATETSDVRLSISNMDHNGMLPGFGQRRTTVGLNGSTALTDRLTGQASMQYIDAAVDNRPAQGYGEDNAMWQFVWFGRQVDTNVLRARRHNPDGSQFNWNNRWNNNPYWTQLEDRNWDSRNRVLGGGSLTYALTPWLELMGRAGTDYSSEHRKNIFAAGTRSVSSATGAFSETAIARQETNADFLLTAQLPGLEGMSLRGTVGGNRRDNNYRSHGANASELVVPGLYDLGNSAVTPTFSDYRSESRVNSLYGSAHFGYRDVWFVDVTGRNDWSSTLPADNNSYFYPSVASSLIFSDLVELPAVSYGKLRLGWARVANDAPVYQLVDPYIGDDPFGSAPRFTASNTLRNFDLKPELTDSWEIGGELRFLDDRFGLDLTYYNSETSNQIVGVQVTPLTGFSSRMVNAGTVANRGIELAVDAVALSLRNGFRWDVMGTFGRNRNEVVELADGLESITLDTYYGVSVEARVGEPYGVMVGRQYVRDSQGNIVVSSTTGRPLNASTNPHDILGNYHPDFTYGLRNRFSYGPVSAHVLIDGQSGGSIYSLTSVYGRRAGVLAETIQGREESADQETMIIPGVMVVDGDTVPNTVPTTAQNYWRLLAGLHEAYVFDASYVKLREIRVGLQVPRSWTNRLGVAAAEVAFIGRNLALWTDVPHIDPETAFNSGNVQGFEYGQTPTPRTFGFSVVLTP